MLNKLKYLKENNDYLNPGLELTTASAKRTRLLWIKWWCTHPATTRTLVKPCSPSIAVSFKWLSKMHTVDIHAVSWIDSIH